MEFVLIICTQAWLLCGQERHITYPTEQACYRALGELYKHNREDAFKYVICIPKVEER